MYHGLEHPEIASLPGAFRAQMKVLAGHCTPISRDQLRDAVAAGRSTRPPVLVTFDDGYLSYR